MINSTGFFSSFVLSKSRLKFNKFLFLSMLCTDENGKTNTSARFAEEDVWITAVQLAEIYNTIR